MKKILVLALLVFTFGFTTQAQNAITTNKAQKTNSFSTTATGLEYKIIKDSIGKGYPETGGFITFWFELRTLNDSIFDSQFADPNPVGIPTPTTAHKKCIEEGFRLLTEGDSAVFILDVDSLYKNTFSSEIPAYIKSGSDVRMIIKMGKVYSKHFVDSTIAAQTALTEMKIAAEQEANFRDSIAIQNYLSKNKFKGEEISDGIYLVKIKSAKKKLPYIVRGEIVETAYIGKLLLDGVVFDQSPSGEYLEFTVGIGEVIKGWDIAFQRLKLGEKALILIPSGMAYGQQGAGGVIPPNAPLLFEVNIKSE